jgi:hypothetical protein
MLTERVLPLTAVGPGANRSPQWVMNAVHREWC